MKKFREFSDLNERVVNIAQRKKQARRMAVLAKSSAFQAKKKRSLMKVRNSQKLLLVAKKQTLMNFRKKAYPNYNDMSIPQKVKADQIIMQRFGAKIDKISKKVAKKLKSKESERIKKLKATAAEKK